MRRNHGLVWRARRKAAHALQSAAHRGLLTNERYLVQLGGYWRLVEPNPGLTALDVAKRNLDLVTDALEEAGVTHWVTRFPEALRSTVGIPATEREAAGAALDRALAGTAAYCQWRGGGRAAATLVARSGIPRAALASPQWRIFILHGQPHTDHVLGRRLGCWINFWEADRDGVLRLDTPGNDFVETLRPRDLRIIEHDREDGGSYKTLEGLVDRPPRFDEVTFPVDVVYTWVDGTDAEWLERRNRYAGLAPDHPEAANAARYIGRDDLKYSLRSLWLFAPFVRRVFLVTDAQVPDWLDTDHPQLTLVDHRDIFRDPNWLPTFNSHAIESQLHHIPDLSEHYLYLNDDVYFGRSVTASRFFHGNGMSKFFLSRHHVEFGPAMPEDPPVMWALKNDRDLLLQQFGRLVTQKVKHVPHPQLRSVQEEMEAKFADAYEQTATARFRKPTDISPASVLHHYYAYLTGRAAAGGIRYQYVDSSANDLRRRLERIAKRRDYHVFCLNDTVAGHDDLVEIEPLLREFLDSYFPLQSPFER